MNNSKYFSFFFFLILSVFTGCGEDAVEEIFYDLTGIWEGSLIIEEDTLDMVLSITDDRGDLSGEATTIYEAENDTTIFTVTGTLDEKAVSLDMSCDYDVSLALNGTTDGEEMSGNGTWTEEEETGNCSFSLAKK